MLFKNRKIYLKCFLMLSILPGCSKDTKTIDELREVKEKVNVLEKKLNEMQKLEQKISKKERANISGKVTYKGAPVTGGVVGFFNPEWEGGGYSAIINSDGTYRASNVPAEEVTITVETETLNPNIGIGAGLRPRKPAKNESVYVKIPGKYAKINTTTLTANLKAGYNTVDLDLED